MKVSPLFAGIGLMGWLLAISLAIAWATWPKSVRNLPLTLPGLESPVPEDLTEVSIRIPDPNDPDTGYSSSLPPGTEISVGGRVFYIVGER